MDAKVKTTKHFEVVSADMPELVTCAVCERNTRTEWKPKKKGLYPIWACSFHTDKEVLKIIKAKRGKK